MSFLNGTYEDRPGSLKLAEHEYRGTVFIGTSGETKEERTARYLKDIEKLSKRYRLIECKYYLYGSDLAY